MAADRGSLKRKPLSDCTNSISTVVADGNRKKVLRSALLQSSRSLSDNNNEAPTASLKSNTSTGSNNPPVSTSVYSPLLPASRGIGKQDTREGKNKRTSVEDATVHQADPQTPVTQKPPLSADAGASFLATPKFKTVYTRKRVPEIGNGKNLKNSEPFSCPPGKRVKDKGKQIDDGKGANQPRMQRNPSLVSKKQTKSKGEVATDAMTKEEVDKLRAYYDDIDAFELPVEEVSDDGLD